MSGTQTLFIWSVKADSRSVHPHIVRAAFAGFMLLAMIGAWGTSLSGFAPGLQFFRYICGLNVVIISVAGISYFVSAVTEEKDAGTLALLRLAGASPLSIILSKSTSRLIGSLMLLLIQMPFTFLAITLGGVTWLQVVAAYLALAAYLCLVANMALFCSVRCSTSGRAASLATAVLALFFLGGPVLREASLLKGVPWLTPRIQRACAELYDQQQMLNISVRLEQLFSTMTGVRLVTSQFWSSLLIAGVFFGLSVILFNRYAAPEQTGNEGLSAGMRRLSLGRCWKLAITWKDFHFATGGKTFFTTKLLAYFTLIAALAWFHQLESPGASVWLSPDLTRLAFLLIAVAFTIEILLFASNSLFQEVRQTAIPQLKMLPLNTITIMLQKVIACMIALMPAVIALASLYVYDRMAVSAVGRYDLPLIRNQANDPTGAIIGWLIFVGVCTHVTVLLSLYVRWAALPLAVFLTVIAYPCIGAAAIALLEITGRTAAVNGISVGVRIGVVINLFWLWLFVLLPIEVELVNRWNRLSQESAN
ncbi:MAG: hypothetical protein R3C49_09180 [Planctomycetaceae bacterium]